jgi:hypothetical protein
VTPRQRAVLVKMVEGIFGVAWIGLLALLPRGYHTISLILTILICTMLGIGALTSIFDRRRALSTLTVYACVGVLSLLIQGYQTLFLVIALAAFGIGALTFLYYEAPYVWRWWFPDQPFGLTVKRWLRYLAQAVVVAVAYVHMRIYINYLTSVDPGNFPTALAALTVLNAIVWWLLSLGLIMLVTAGVYAGLAFMASLRGKFGPAEIGGVSATRWGLRMAGAGSLFLVSMMAIGLPSDTRWMQRAARILVTNVLVFTEYSYNQTCSVSSEQRLVAHLKDRKEMRASIISIADNHGRAWPSLWWIFPLMFFQDYTFSRGTCDDQSQP